MQAMKFDNIIIIAIVAIALLMETLDTTIINTSIPQIAASFGENPILLKFALTSYLLSLAIFIPVSGWMADRFGEKTIFIYAIILFACGSICCGLSNNLVQLIFSRILQGLGGAFMMPVGRLILMRSFTREKLIMITNAIAIPSLLGPALGPVLGGFITTYWSWRWVFFVNLPFAMLCLLLVGQYISINVRQTYAPFNWYGFIIFSLAALSLSAGFETIGDELISMHASLLLILFSILLFVFYGYYAKKIKNVFIDLSLFKIDTFKCTALIITWSRIGFGGIPFLLPLLFQASLNMTPLQSGLLILPMPIGMLLMKFLVKPILAAQGFKNTLKLIVISLSVSILSFAFINRSTLHVVICILTFLFGCVCSLYYACTDVLIYAEVDEKLMSRATSLVSALQQLSISFGVAISALSLRFFSHASNLSQSINIHAFNHVFLVLAAIMLTVSYILIYMRDDVGDEICGRAMYKAEAIMEKME